MMKKQMFYKLHLYNTGISNNNKIAKEYYEDVEFEGMSQEALLSERGDEAALARMKRFKI
jgi:hypothetical protein